MHDIDSTDTDTVPYHVNSEHTLNWFRVFWEGGAYPGSSTSNTCAANQCTQTADESCLCKTTVVESVVFDDVASISKMGVMSKLFIGAAGNPSDSVASVGDGFISHIVAGNVDASTVFEVQDKRKTFFLKNIRSIVKLSTTNNTPSLSFRNPPHFMSKYHLSYLHCNVD